MHSTWALTYVGVGSNIRPEENVPRALEALDQLPEVSITGISTFYRTAALPDPQNATALPTEGIRTLDPDFLNGVVEIRTMLSPPESLALLDSTEQALGRKRPGKRYAPRTIDLDLLLYGREEGEDLKVVWQEIGPHRFLAHSDIERRPFVAHPLFARPGAAPPSAWDTSPGPRRQL